MAKKQREARDSISSAGKNITVRNHPAPLSWQECVTHQGLTRTSRAAGARAPLGETDLTRAFGARTVKRTVMPWGPRPPFPGNILEKRVRPGTLFSTRAFLAALCVTAQNWRPHRRPSTGERQPWAGVFT